MTYVANYYLLKFLTCPTYTKGPVYFLNPLSFTQIIYFLSLMTYICGVWYKLLRQVLIIVSLNITKGCIAVFLYFSYKEWITKKVKREVFQHPQHFLQLQFWSCSLLLKYLVWI